MQLSSVFFGINIYNILNANILFTTLNFSAVKQKMFYTEFLNKRIRKYIYIHY